MASTTDSWSHGPGGQKSKIKVSAYLRRPFLERKPSIIDLTLKCKEPDLEVPSSWIKTFAFLFPQYPSAILTQYCHRLRIRRLLIQMCAYQMCFTELNRHAMATLCLKYFPVLLLSLSPKILSVPRDWSYFSHLHQGSFSLLPRLSCNPTFPFRNKKSRTLQI